MQAQKKERVERKTDAREEALQRLREAMPGGYIVIDSMNAEKGYEPLESFLGPV